MLAILAFRKPMQKDLEFKASLSVNKQLQNPKLPFQAAVPKLGCQCSISRLERGRGPWVHNVPHTALRFWHGVRHVITIITVGSREITKRESSQELRYISCCEAHRSGRITPLPYSTPISSTEANLMQSLGLTCG